MFKIIQSIIRMLRGEISTNKLIKRGLKVGENFNRQGHVIIDPPHCWLIEIGNNVTLADGVYILAHDASTKNATGYTKIGNVKIGNNVFVGARTVILPNVHIGDNVIIGAGSIVTKDIENNSVVAGNPAIIIEKYDVFVNKNNEKIIKSGFFSEDYTLRKKITNEKKHEMKKKLEKGMGFVK